MTTQMFDSTNVAAIPPTAQAVAGYVDGSALTYWSVVARCPAAMHLSIATAAEVDAECLDLEAGNLAQAPEWVQRQQARGISRPVVYAAVAAVPVLLNLLHSNGIEQSAVRVWTAHYTEVPHLCTPACGFGLASAVDATQWTDRALGESLNESLCSDAFFGPPPPPRDPYQYDRYPVGPFPYRDSEGVIVKLDERAVVQEYDHLRIHAKMNTERLQELHPLLRFLRKRVWYAANYNLQTHTKLEQPTWNACYRRWRWEMLLARCRGEVIGPTTPPTDS
jgi:hypothetical protein